jgi:hypothetical protein
VNAYCLPIKGWVIGKQCRATHVDVIHEGASLLSIPVTQRRPDVLRQYPQTAAAERCGFSSMLSVLGLPLEFDLRIEAVLEDGERLELAVVRVRRAPLAVPQSAVIEPLLITTLGRTGSTWLLHVLGQHPAIIAYGTFRYEPRVAGCWASIFRRLAAPQSYRFQLRPDLEDRFWWLGDSNVSAGPPIAEPAVEEWLGRDHVEDLAAFCRGRVEALYSQVKKDRGCEAARYFSEKSWPDAALVPAIYELFPRTKELLLVRDFRDMVCSIAAFNAKRGAVSFGRQSAASDEDHVRGLRVGAMRMLEAWHARRDRAHLVRYEDLIESPHSTLKQILAYLDLDAHDELIRRMLQAASQQAADVQTWHQTAADVGSSIGRWREDLTPQLSAVCRETFADVLDRFGYDADSAARRPIAPTDIALVRDNTSGAYALT